MAYIPVTKIKPVPRRVNTSDPPSVRETSIAFFNRCINCKKNLDGYVFRIRPVCSKECGSTKMDKDADGEKPKNKKRGRKDYKPVRFIPKE